MEREVANLERRVAELEAALAIVSKRRDRPELRRWVTLAPLMCAGMLILCVGIFLGEGTGSFAAAQGGPSKVVAPFQVVDKTGRVLFKVAMHTQGTGVAIVYDAQENEMVTLGVSSPALGKYPIQVSSPEGNTKVGIGVNAAGEGVVVLNSKAKSTLGLTGAGIVKAHNAQDKRTFVLGPLLGEETCICTIAAGLLW